MCCVNDPETVEEFLKKNKNRKQFVFYKVYDFGDDNNLHPACKYQENIILPGIINSNSRANPESIRKRCMEIGRGNSCSR